MDANSLANKRTFSFVIQRSKMPANQVTYFLKGPMTEFALTALNSIYEELSKDKSSEVVFNFAEVDFLNSMGVQQWVQFMRKINHGRSIIFEECSAQIIMYVTIINAFKGNAFIRSFYCPYFCPACKKTFQVLLKTAEIPPNTIPAAPECKCGTMMELEETEEDFFYFLKHT